MIKTLSKIYQFSGKMQGTMKKAILFSVLHSLFDMMSFGALAMVFSGLTDGFTTSMIWMIFGITLASMLLKIYCSYISDFGKVQIGYFMCAEKRIHIGDRMKYMPMGYFNDHNLGNLTSVVTTTMGDIENNASMVLTNILGGYIHAAIITIVMLCIDWRIGLTILCGILLFTWCIGRLQKKSETVSPQRQQAQEALVSNVLEYVQGMLIVKSFNLGQNSNSKMRQAILDSKDKNLKLERTFVPYNMLQQIILYGTSILVIVEGLYFYLNGTMALSICLLMTVASFMLFSQLQSAGNTSALLRLLDVSIDKVNEIDKTPVMDEHGKPVKPENYNIVFDDVSFSYGEHQVLDHVSLTIPERTVTAIVGPSGAGKSTIARAAARRFGLIYVDTGAIYRTVGLAGERAGVNCSDADAMQALLPALRIELVYDAAGEQRMLLNGEDVSDTIRLPEVSLLASRVSALPVVRAFLLDMQRSLARTHSVVMDGRDIGTVVLPDAGLKIFLSASAECRAQRRWRQLQEKGIQEPYADVLRELEQRDYDDTHRAIAPLKAAPDAVHIDTSELTLEQSIDAVCAAVRTRFGLEVDA